MKTVRDYTNGSVFLTLERVYKLQNKKKLSFQISFSNLYSPQSLIFSTRYKITIY